MTAQYITKDTKWSANHETNGLVTVFHGLKIVHETHINYDDAAVGKVWALITSLRNGE